MIKVLLDHNLHRKLKQSLPNHEVVTTREMGWEAYDNGDLLVRAVDKRFDVFLTCDASIPYQQNAAKYDIGIVVIRAYDNRFNTHIHFIEEIEKALSSVIALLN